MKKKSLKQLLAEHAEAVKKGCTCAAPSQKSVPGFGKMIFAPRSAACPLHGELAS